MEITRDKAIELITEMEVQELERDYKPKSVFPDLEMRFVFIKFEVKHGEMTFFIPVVAEADPEELLADCVDRIGDNYYDNAVRDGDGWSVYDGELYYKVLHWKEILFMDYINLSNYL